MEDIEFRKLYRICCRKKLLTKEKTEEIVNLFQEEVTIDCNAEVYNHQSFKTFHGYKITTNNKVAFFPSVPAGRVIEGSKSLNSIRNTFKTVELAIPPYIQLGYLSKLSKNIQESEDSKKYKVLEEWFYENYPINFVATLYTERYLQVKSIRPFKIQLLELIEAFYQGLYNLSILSFLPIIEGVIRNIGKLVGTNTDSIIDKERLLDVLEKCEKRVINDIVYYGIDWVPSDYKAIKFLDKFNEHIQMIESLKHYINAKLYKYSKDFEGKTALNRPSIIHGFVTDFSSPCNFFRLITILNILACISSLVGDKGSLWAPEQSEKSKKLTTHLKTGWDYGRFRRSNLSSIGLNYK